jgi:hypothetical protein
MDNFINISITDLIGTGKTILSFKRTIGKKMLNPAIESHKMTMKDFTGFSEIMRSQKIMLNKSKKFQIRRLMGHIFNFSKLKSITILNVGRCKEKYQEVF